MAVKSQSYDHSTYVTRIGVPMDEIGGGATTQYGKFVAFTALQAYNAVLTVTVAGTAAGHTIAINKISGTATTAIGTATPGTTAVGGANSVLQIPLTTVAGGLSLLQGDILVAVTGADTVGKVALAYELSVTPVANITV
jgi:hypothetical protein